MNDLAWQHENIIKKCIEGDRKAQSDFFNQYKGILFGLCRRYFNDSSTAEDVFVEGFVKIFHKLPELQNPDSIEPWMKRIMVNEALMYIRKNKNIKFNELDQINELSYDDFTIEKLNKDQVLDLFDLLPEGYRTILNLYAIEGYKHHEIAEMLGISINTSKSQLIHARKKIYELYKNLLN